MNFRLLLVTNNYDIMYSNSIKSEIVAIELKFAIN